MTDARTTFGSYLLTRSYRVRVLIAAISAGLFAIYGPMIIVALCGVWTNNLFRWNTNWPWAFLFAAFNLVSSSRSISIALHGLIFISLAIWKSLSLWALTNGHMFEPSVVAVFFLCAALPIVNVIAYSRIAKRLELPSWPRLFDRDAQLR